MQLGNILKALFIGMIFIALIIPNVFSSWYYTGWDYKRPINIQENSGNDLTEYQVKLELNLSQEFSLGKIQQNCSDVRFTYYNSTSGTEEEIPYWIEQCNLTNNDTAIIWVKVPYILANGNSTIYMYYGNPSATSESNGTVVFEFFDDMETWTGWVQYGDGQVTQDSTRAYEGTYSAHKTTAGDPSGAYKPLPTTLGRDIILEAWLNRNSNYTSGPFDRIGLIDDNGNGYGVGYDHPDEHTLIDVRNAYTATPSNGAVIGTGSTAHLDVWYKLVMKLNSTHVIAEKWYNGVLEETVYLANSTYTTFTNFYIFGGYDYWVDLVKIRKYTDPEPTYTVLSELTNMINITSPTETEYYQNWVYLNFTTIKNCSVVAYLDNNEVYPNTSLTANTSVSVYLGNLTHGNHTITINATSQELTITKEIRFSVIKYNILNYTILNSTNETQLNEYNVSVVVYAPANVSYSIEYNNQTSKGYLNTSNQTFTAYFSAPLVPDNNNTITVNYSYSVNISFLDGEVISWTSGILNQTVYKVINSTVELSPNISVEKQTVTATLKIYNPMNNTELNIDAKGNVSCEPNLGLTCDNKTITFDYVNREGNYSIYQAVFEMPTIKGENTSDVDISLNVIINTNVNISFQNSSRLETANSSGKLYMIKIRKGNCGNSGQSFKFQMIDEQTNSNVNGAITNEIKLWYKDVIRNYTKYNTGGVMCLYVSPSWATYHADMMLTYSADNYVSRSYVITNTTVDNVSETITLYTTQLVNSTPVTVKVYDSKYSPVNNITVVVQRWYQGTAITVTSGKTDTQGKVTFMLIPYTVYYRFILYNSTGKEIYATESELITTNEKIIVIPSEYQNIFQPKFMKTNINCTIINKNDTANRTLICEVVYTDGNAYLTTLEVFKEYKLFTTKIHTMTKQASTVVFTYHIPSDIKTLKYSVYVIYGKYKELLYSDVVEFEYTQTNPNDLFLSFIIVAGLGLLGVIAPEAVILFSIVGVIVSVFLGLLNVSLTFIIPLIIAFIITMLRRL